VPTRSSPQTRLVLEALSAEPERWRYGYDLLRVTGLKSGSLYPILARLTERGWLEATWEEDGPPGRPRRHLYRVTAEGARAAAVSQAGGRRSVVRRRRLAGETG